MRPALIILTLASQAVVATGLVCAQESEQRSPSPSPHPEVLVLGVYHMSNPGRDVVNMEADDVLSSRRQREIAELITVLKRFNPTKIAVEGAFSSNAIPSRYADYVSGGHDLTRNETEQIGFRLAKELGHSTIHPVDVHGEFPHLRVVGYAKAHDRSAEFDALMGEIHAMIEDQSNFLASHTVLETLLYMNSEKKIAESMGYYFRQAHFGEPWDWAGADLVSDWFRRNMRIYSNIVHLLDSPAERVLVVYGAGHLGWLQLSFATDPTFRLRHLREFVP